MAGEIPFWSGKDLKLKIFVNKKTLVVDMMTLTVKENAVEANDGVCGEDRDRLQKITNFFEVTIEGKQQKMALIDAFLDEQQVLDDRQTPAEGAIAILIFFQDGTQAAYQCREYTRGPWSMDAKGRTERNTVSVPGRARYFDKLKSLG